MSRLGSSLKITMLGCPWLSNIRHLSQYPLIALPSRLLASGHHSVACALMDFSSSGHYHMDPNIFPRSENLGSQPFYHSLGTSSYIFIASLNRRPFSDSVNFSFTCPGAHWQVGQVSTTSIMPFPSGPSLIHGSQNEVQCAFCRHLCPR